MSILASKPPTCILDDPNTTTVLSDNDYREMIDQFADALTDPQIGRAHV